MNILGRVLVAAVTTIGVIASVSQATPQPDPSASETTAPHTWGIVPSGADGPDGRSAFEYAVDPGTTITDVVGVINYSENPLPLDVYANDAVLSTNGGFDLLPAADEPVDVGAWVSLDESTITIPARSRVDLPFELTVPDDATPGDHAGGIVASLTTAAADGGQVAVDRRVGVRIYLRVSGTHNPSLSISDVRASFDGFPIGTPGDVRVEYTVRNDGNMRLVGRPSATVAGLFGLGERRWTGDPLPELRPGDSITSTAVIPDAWQLGRLHVEVDVQPEASSGEALDPAPGPDTATTILWAVPWITLVALAVLVVLAIWRRRRRRLPARADNQEKTANARQKEGQNL